MPAVLTRSLITHSKLHRNFLHQDSWVEGFSLSPHQAEGAGKPCASSFIKVLAPIRSTEPSRSNALPSNTITLGIRFSTCRFWENTNVQTVADVKIKNSAKLLKI